MIKLMAFDIDGTILRSDQTISPATLKQLHEAEKDGIQWLLATGRNYHIVTPILKRYQLQCDLILNSGHEYRDKHGTLQAYFPMEDNIAKELIMLLQMHNYNISIHTTYGKYIIETPQQYWHHHLMIMEKLHPEVMHQSTDQLQQIHELLLTNTTYVNNIGDIFKNENHVLKIDARTLDLSKATQAITAIEKLPTLVIHSSYDDYMEISSNNANKATTLQFVLDHYQINHDEVAVFGDSMNDLEMFETFPNSFAMGNAITPLKKLAKWTVDTNNQDGVAKGIEMIRKLNNENK